MLVWELRVAIQQTVQKSFLKNRILFQILANPIYLTTNTHGNTPEKELWI
jgi:hypothetical protein